MYIFIQGVSLKLPCFSQILKIVENMNDFFLFSMPKKLFFLCKNVENKSSLTSLTIFPNSLCKRVIQIFFLVGLFSARFPPVKNAYASPENKRPWKDFWKSLKKVFLVNMTLIDEMSYQQNIL